MKKVTTLSLLFILFTSAAIIGTKLSQNYSSSEHKYQISYPKGWKIDESKGPDYIKFIGPIIDSILFKTDGAFAISVQTNGKVITTTEIYNGNMKNMQTKLNDFKIIEEGEMLLGKVKCKYVVHQAKMEASIVTSLQFYLCQGKKSFVLGGTVPAETLGKYRNLYFDIAKSITFSKK